MNIKRIKDNPNIVEMSHDELKQIALLTGGQTDAVFMQFTWVDLETRASCTSQGFLVEREFPIPKVEV